MGDTKGQVLSAGDGIGLVKFDLADGQTFEDTLTIEMSRQAALVTMVTMTGAVRDHDDMLNDARRNGAPSDVMVLLRANLQILQDAARAVVKATLPDTYAEMLVREEVEREVRARQSK